MPTYDYVCEACSHRFDVFQSMSEEPIKTCPECGAEKARRIIGKGAGIIFKGSGFYETDYKRSRTKDKPEKSSETKSETKSSESKSDSKSSD